MKSVCWGLLDAPDAKARQPLVEALQQDARLAHALRHRDGSSAGRGCSEAGSLMSVSETKDGSEDTQPYSASGKEHQLFNFKAQEAKARRAPVGGGGGVGGGAIVRLAGHVAAAGTLLGLCRWRCIANAPLETQLGGGLDDVQYCPRPSCLQVLGSHPPTVRSPQRCSICFRQPPQGSKQGESLHNQRLWRNRPHGP